MNSRSGMMVNPVSLPFFRVSRFLFVEQEFAVATGGVVVVSAVEIFGYIHVFDPYLALVDIAECVGERSFALTD